MGDPMTTITITDPDADLRDRIASVLADADEFDGVAEAELNVTSEQRAERGEQESTDA